MAFKAVSSSGIPISTGLRIGIPAWGSRVGARPSQKSNCSTFTLSVVGAFRLPMLVLDSLRDWLAGR